MNMYSLCKSLLFFICFTFFSISVQAQKDLDPVSWEGQLVKLASGQYEIRMTANMDEKWVIYSQFIDDDGPIPTFFSFDMGDGISLEGGVKEPKNVIIEQDEMFMMELRKFKNQATFTQKINSKQAIEKVNCSVTFMTCDNMRCLPPKTVEFVAKLVRP